MQDFPNLSELYNLFKVLQLPKYDVSKTFFSQQEFENDCKLAREWNMNKSILAILSLNKNLIKTTFHFDHKKTDSGFERNYEKDHRYEDFDPDFPVLCEENFKLYQCTVRLELKEFKPHKILAKSFTHFDPKTAKLRACLKMVPELIDYGYLEAYHDYFPRKKMALVELIDLVVSENERLEFVSIHQYYRYYFGIRNVNDYENEDIVKSLPVDVPIDFNSKPGLTIFRAENLKFKPKFESKNHLDILRTMDSEFDKRNYLTEKYLKPIIYTLFQEIASYIIKTSYDNLKDLIMMIYDEKKLDFENASRDFCKYLNSTFLSSSVDDLLLLIENDGVFEDLDLEFEMFQYLRMIREEVDAKEKIEESLVLSDEKTTPENDSGIQSVSTEESSSDENVKHSFRKAIKTNIKSIITKPEKKFRNEHNRCKNDSSCNHYVPEVFRNFNTVNQSANSNFKKSDIDFITAECNLIGKKLQISKEREKEKASKIIRSFKNLDELQNFSFDQIYENFVNFKKKHKRDVNKRRWMIVKVDGRKESDHSQNNLMSITETTETSICGKLTSTNRLYIFRVRFQENEPITKLIERDFYIFEIDEKFAKKIFSVYLTIWLAENGILIEKFCVNQELIESNRKNFGPPPSVSISPKGLAKGKVRTRILVN